tara:strand:+ start:419 stop:745 length:327 start_codon:yes stop_codon:yes gene_type:complete
MSWEDIIKEKYSGPQQEGGRFIMLNANLMKIEQQISFLEKEIDKPNELSKTMIEYNVKQLRILIDAFDKELIEVAKYGGSPLNLPTERQDSKWLSNYGAKYRKTEDGV